METHGSLYRWYAGLATAPLRPGIAALDHVVPPSLLTPATMARAPLPVKRSCCQTPTTCSGLEGSMATCGSTSLLICGVPFGGGKAGLSELRSETCTSGVSPRVVLKR